MGLVPPVQHGAEQLGIGRAVALLPEVLVELYVVDRLLPLAGIHHGCLNFRAAFAAFAGHLQREQDP
jgi:hypothetical protein